MRVKNRWQLSYYLMFMLRRTAFLYLGLFITNERYTNFQVQGAMYLNLIFGIYVCANKSWLPPIYNRLELLNESLIAFSTFQLVFFTDYVEDIKLRSSLGWMRQTHTKHLQRDRLPTTPLSIGAQIRKNSRVLFSTPLALWASQTRRQLYRHLRMTR